MNNVSNLDSIDKYIEEKLASLRLKMIEQENIRHNQFLDHHFKKYTKLAEKHDSYISQLITLESAILGATVIFTNSQQVTVWLIIANILTIVSLGFGVWSQRLAVESGYQSLEWNYVQEERNHLRSRELWKDSTLEYDKDLIETELNKQEIAFQKKIEYKLLKALHLNADRVANIFIVSFIFSLLLLIMHLIFKAPVLLNPIISG